MMFVETLLAKGNIIAFLKAALAVAHKMHLFVILDQYCTYLNSIVRLVR